MHVLGIKKPELGVRPSDKSARRLCGWWYISGHLWKRIAEELARMKTEGFLDALQGKWL
jgi:hypothetical protein